MLAMCVQRHRFSVPFPCHFSQLSCPCLALTNQHPQPAGASRVYGYTGTAVTPRARNIEPGLQMPRP